MMANQRTMPLWVRAHQTLAPITPKPTTPTMITARPACKPIPSRGTSTAAAAATMAPRASHRWATVARPRISSSIVAIPDHHPRSDAYLA